MTKHLFYYVSTTNAPCTKYLTVQHPLQPSLLSELSHDFQTSLTKPVSLPQVALTKLDRAKSRAQVTTAQKGFKSLQDGYPATASESRDEVIRAILASKTPNWGGIRINPCSL